MSIGRGADNTIVLDDDSVSGHHAEVFIRDGQHFLRDLESTNGTRVNGQAITETVLNNGDVICFGSIEGSFTAAPQSSVAVQVADDTQAHANAGSIPNAEQPGSSMGSKLANLGKAAWQETKKNSHLLSLKAQIEKLTRIDLRQAHQQLGRKCYELKLHADHFATSYQEIMALEQRIAGKRKGVHADADAKTMGKIRAAAEDQASKVAAEALNVKLGGLFADVGKAAAAMPDSAELPEDGLSAVRSTQAKIRQLEASRDAIPTSTAPRSKLVYAATFIGFAGFLAFLGLTSSKQQSATGDQQHPYSKLSGEASTRGSWDTVVAPKAEAPQGSLRTGELVENFSFKTIDGDTKNVQLGLILIANDHACGVVNLHEAGKDDTYNMVETQDVRAFVKVKADPTFSRIASQFVRLFNIEEDANDYPRAQRAFFDSEKFKQWRAEKAGSRELVPLARSVSAFKDNTKKLFALHFRKELLIVRSIDRHNFEAKEVPDSIPPGPPLLLKTSFTVIENPGMIRIACDYKGFINLPGPNGFAQPVRLYEEQRASEESLYTRLTKQQEALETDLLTSLREGPETLKEVGNAIDSLADLYGRSGPKLGSANYDGYSVPTDFPPGLLYCQYPLFYGLLRAAKESSQR